MSRRDGVPWLGIGLAALLATLLLGLAAAFAIRLSPKRHAADAQQAAKVPSHTACDFEVSVVRVAIEGDRTRCDVIVTTSNPEKSLQFVAWSDRNVSLTGPMVDDLGNRYRLLSGPGRVRGERPIELGERWAASSKPAVRSVKDGHGQVTASVARIDTLYFEAPVPKASTLTLTLPAKNIGAEADLVFRFDTASIPSE